MTLKKKRPDGVLVNGIGEALELNTLLVQFSDQIDQVLDTTAKAIQLPHNQSGAFAQHFQRLGKSGDARPGCR